MTVRKFMVVTPQQGDQHFTELLTQVRAGVEGPPHMHSHPLFQFQLVADGTCSHVYLVRGCLDTSYHHLVFYDRYTMPLCVSAHGSARHPSAGEIYTHVLEVALLFSCLIHQNSSICMRHTTV